MELSRRTLLGTVGVVTAASAGCLDAGPGDGSDGTGSGDRDAVPVLTGFEVSDHALAPDAERHSDTDAWGLLVASREAADGYFGDLGGPDAEAVRTFVEESDFESGDQLLFVEAYAPQTCYELVLASDPRVAANGLPSVEALVERLVPDDEPCDDAMTPVQLLLRLSFDPDEPPADVVEVSVSGHRDEPEELLLEAER